MINTEDLIKIKEYDTYILFKHKDTEIKECFLKIDLEQQKNERIEWNKWNHIRGNNK